MCLHSLAVTCNDVSDDLEALREEAGQQQVPHGGAGLLPGLAHEIHTALVCTEETA